MVVEEYHGSANLMPTDIGFKIKVSLSLRKQ
jgi:hypothetical protein